MDRFINEEKQNKIAPLSPSKGSDILDQLSLFVFFGINKRYSPLWWFQGQEKKNYIPKGENNHKKHENLFAKILTLLFDFLTNCSALLISSNVTPCVERRVSRTRLAWAFRCVSLSSSLVGGTNDLK
jgi:hypothetical protein